MKLYKISQTENQSYDTFDSAIVAAESENEAKNIHPSGDNDYWKDRYNTWCNEAISVSAEYIGEACEGTELGVILASFNAG